MTGNSDIFVNLPTGYAKSLQYLSSLAFNLLDLVGVEETEILPDMSVNFKDLQLKLALLLQFVRGHVRHFPQGPQVDRLFIYLSFNVPLNSL